jgi:two-component system cell cycle sensor histidine kinase/response regulator CckA
MRNARRTEADLAAELRALRRQLVEVTAATRSAAGSGAALRQLETRYHHALRNARALIVEFDARGALTYVSPSVAHVLGYRPDEVMEHFGFGSVHEEDRPQVEEAYRKLLVAGQTQSAVYRVLHKDGRWVWLETNASACRTDDGVGYTVAMSRDVSELMRANDALRRSEARYRPLAENASDLILEVDDDGRLLFVSPNCEEITGRSAEELLGRTIFESGIDRALHPDDVKDLPRAYRNAVGSNANPHFVYRYRHPDDRWRWFECTAKRYRTGDGERRAVVIARDATARVEAEQKLRQSEERFRVLARTSLDLVTEIDAEGRLVYASPNCREVLGYTPEEMMNADPFLRLHPDDLQRGSEGFAKLTGSVGPVKLASFRVRHCDGSYRWLQCSGVTYRTAEGELRLVAVSRDVTEERRVAEERRLLEQRMQHAQKLEGLGVMAGGIAHDFNNLLTPILGEAGLGLTELAPDSPLRARLDRIVTAASRAAALTRQMQAYAGTESLEPERLDVSRSLREIAQLIESAATRRAVLEYDLREGLPAIEADAAQLSQVAMSLVSNASEALGEGTGRIAIRTGAVEADRAALSRTFPGDELPEGTYVYLEIADTGGGMDEATRARIFDPFFTTKFTGRGLGLAAVLGIVRAHHGAIEVESESGCGTRIRVLFPAAEGIRGAIAEAAADGSWRGDGTVLVVEDDPGVLRLATETLERAGFDVIGVRDAREAIETFRGRADAIRLVLLDGTMPALSSEAAFEALRSIRPDARVVLVSGHAEESARQPFTGRGLAGFVHKPFPPAALLSGVRAALESDRDNT